ncbi:MAG: hypothetical protein ABH825_03940 [Candidatus Omnitrophota bacterium]
MGIPAEYLIFKVNILKKTFLIASGVCLTALVFNQRGFALGFFVGGILSILIFSLLYKYVLELNDLSPSRKRSFLVPRSLLLSAIMGAALFIGIKKGLPVFFGTAAGILSLRISIFSETFKRKYAGA